MSHLVMGANGEGICSEDLQPVRKLVVYPGTEAFRLGHDIQATPLHALYQQLALKAPA